MVKDDSEKIVILGGGAQADETETYLDREIKEIYRAISKKYITNESQSHLIDISGRDHVNLGSICAVGAPLLKKRLLDLWQGKTYVSVIDKASTIKPDSIVSEGVTIGPNSTISTGCKIMPHVIINIGVNISHDCEIGEYSTISPGVNIAGNVKIGKGVFVGIGASISNGVTIADGCVIGAGSVILDDIEQKNSVVVGAPAKTIRINKDWLSEI